MTYTEETKPGMGDPYWYEWSVGQQYILEMLYLENNIESVSLQANISLGLDDVVVKYKDHTVLCVQVKHTRSNDTITFGDLITEEVQDEANKNRKSLLAELAESWYIEKNNYTRVIPMIFTNRVIGKKSSRAKIEEKDEKYLRPALDIFWRNIKIQLNSVNSLSEIVLPDKEWNIAWGEWQEQLMNIKKDQDKLEFLKLLKIETSKPSLSDITTELLDKLSSIFGISTKQAESLLANFDHALRKWATSQRTKSEITVEDVYNALSIEPPVKKYNHDLVPPYPFFKSRKKIVQDLTTELLQGEKPIVFLSGIPGIGKTSIVSELTNNREPVIDIRYYAYKPIQPDAEYLPIDASDRVRPDIFWNELLSQLRTLLRGNLHKYNIPLRNDFLTLEQIRTTFLEIANKWGQDRDRPIIVAIDGIDHAARAGVNQSTFLETLVHPEMIPTNIKFLISGQPIEAYEKYPHWLKNNEQRVSYWTVPLINEDDIKSIIDSTSDIILPKDQHNALARLIFSISEGNTLSAIFAVYESKDCLNINEVSEKLKFRNLSGNISEYYNTIWKAAIYEINQHFPFMEYRLAGCFSLLSERINGSILSQIFSDQKITIYDWHNILKSLRPLVIYEKNGYRLLHNDVRVFLSKIIDNDLERLSEIASYIASYYKKSDRLSLYYYNDLFKFLEISRREVEIAHIFTPKYVIGAFVSGLSLYDLRMQSIKALNALLQINDWNYIHQVMCAVNTLKQVEYTIDGMDRVNENSNSEVMPLMDSECYVIPPSSWNIKIISDVISDILRLIKIKQIERATGLIERWFHNLSLTGIVDKIPIDERYESYGRDKKIISRQFKEIFHNLGEANSNLDQFVNLFNGITRKSKEIYKTAMIEYCSGYLQQAIEISTGLNLAHKLQNVKTFYWADYDNLVIKLMKEQRLLDLGIFIRLFGEIKDMPVGSKIYTLVAVVLLGKEKSFIRDGSIKIIEDILQIEIDYGVDKSEITVFCMLGFSIGALELSKDTESISKLISEKYFLKHQNSDRQSFAAVIFNASAFLGRWASCLNRFDIKKTKEFIDIYTVKRLFEALYEKKWSHNQEIWDSTDIKGFIIELMIICSELTGVEYQTLISEKLSNLYSTYPVNYLISSGWKYYYAKKEISFLKNWFENWCGIQGTIWDLDVYERNEVANKFKKLVKQYSLENEISLDYLNEKLKWSIVGYASRKDYSLGYPLEWFKKIVKYDISYWEDGGVDLIQISQAVNELGDNRMDMDICSQFFSAVCKSGLDSLWRIYNNDYFTNLVCEDSTNIIDGLVGMLETVILSKQELLALWALGIGSLDWRDGVGQCYLDACKTAIITASKRLKINDIEAELYSLGKAEYNTVSDPVRFRLPRRWFSHEENHNNTSDYVNVEKELQIRTSELENTVDTNYGERSNILVSLLERLGEQNIELQQKYLKDILYKIDSTDKCYGWNYSQQFDIYEYILPLLSEANALEFTHHLIKKRNDENLERWNINELALDISKICLWRIETLGVNSLKQGFDRLIDMHQIWITGDNHLSEIREIRLGDTYTTTECPKTWAHFAIQRLLYLLCCEDAEVAECSLKGIWALIKVDSSHLEYVLQHWKDLHYRAKEWILFIIERCIYSNIGEPETVLSFLEIGINSPDLNVKLYSLILMHNYCIKFETNLTEIVFEKQPFFKDIPCVDSGAKFIQESARGPAVFGLRVARRYIKFLKAATWDDCSDIQSIFLSFLPSFKLESYKFKKCSEKHIKIAVHLSKEVQCLNQILYRELLNGRWGDVPFIRICQSLLSATEPYILLESPAEAKDYDKWPVDEELRDLLNKDIMSQKQTFENIIISNIEDDEIVLGAVLYTYSYKSEVCVTYTTSFCSIANLLDPIPSLSVFNGRSYMFSDSERYEPDENRNLTYFNGGIGCFPNQSLLNFPSSCWEDVFDWKPELGDAIIWRNAEGQKVVRFEYLYGKYRWISREPNFHQPIMQRWIGKKNSIHSIECMYNVKLKRLVEVDKSEMDN